MLVAITCLLVVSKQINTKDKCNMTIRSKLRSENHVMMIRLCNDLEHYNDDRFQSVGVAEWIERRTSNQKVAGSSPVKSSFFLFKA